MGDEKHNAPRRNRRRRKLLDKKQSKISDAFPYKCNKELTNIKPFITKDSKHIICGSGRKVLLFRLKTGLLEKTFEDHEKDVIAIFPHEKNPLQVISCTENEVIFWDYTDLSVSKTFKVPFKMLDVFMPTAKKAETIFCVSIIEKELKRNRTVLFQYNVITQEKVMISTVSKGYKKFAISKSESFVALIYKKNLKIYDLSNSNILSYKFDETALTCVAIHPSTDTIATGDKEGKIVLWHNICGTQKDPICSKMHWHNNEVHDLLFMNDGFYMVSGGKEGVLVIWQLENQQKNFLPRVGGSIKHLFQSNDGQHIGFAIDSNVIKLLSIHDSKLTKAIKGLSPAYDLSAGLSYDSKTDCLVLNGRPDAIIQFYHPLQDSVKLNLDVVGENLVSSVEERHVYPSRVEKIAFSKDGLWMATIVVREDKLLPTERTLKFWKYSDKNYCLNSVVEPVHADDIYVLLFRPHQLNYSAITTSKDGNIKSWQLTEEKTRKGERIEAWQLHSMGSYGKQSCHQACFSADGSLLAVLFSDITLWDPENLSHESTISWNFELNPIKSLTFCHKESSQYLIGCSDKTIVSWNISTLEVAWKMECEVKLVASDPSSKYFVAFIWFKETNKLHLYLFDPSVPTPAALLYNIQQEYLSLKSAVFTPRAEQYIGNTIWTKIGFLYYLNDMNIMRIVEIEEIKTNNKVSNISNEKSAFEELFGVVQKQSIHVNNNKSLPVGNPASTFIQKILTTPTHVLPSTDILCKVFLMSLLVSKPSPNVREPIHEDFEVEKDNLSEHDHEILEIVSSQAVPKDISPIDLIKLPAYDFTFVKEYVEK